jgi:hypothetical protein
MASPNAIEEISVPAPPGAAGAASGEAPVGPGPGESRKDKKNKYGLTMSEKALKLLGVFEDEKEHRGSGSLGKASKMLGMRPDATRLMHEVHLKRLQVLRKQNVITFEEFVALRAESNKGDHQSIVRNIITRLNKEAREEADAAAVTRDGETAAAADGGDGAADGTDTVFSTALAAVMDTSMAGQGEQQTAHAGRNSHISSSRRRSSLTDAERLVLGVREMGFGNAAVGDAILKKSSEARTSDIVDEHVAVGAALRRPISPYATTAATRKK